MNCGMNSARNAIEGRDFFSKDTYFFKCSDTVWFCFSPYSSVEGIVTIHRADS